MSDLTRVVELGEDLCRAQQELDLIRVQYAREWARYYYGGCTDVRGSHPILHGLGYDAPVFGLRQDRHGALVVPAFQADGAIGSLVRVRPDGEHEHVEGATLWRTSYELNHRQNPTVVIVTPDIQDALLCYRVMMDARVFVGFTEENSRRIAGGLRGMVCLTLEPWADLWAADLAFKWDSGAYRTRQQAQMAADAWMASELQRQAVWRT